MVAMSKRKRMFRELCKDGWRRLQDSPEKEPVRIKCFDGSEHTAIKTAPARMSQRAWFPTRPPYRPIFNVVAWKPLCEVFPRPADKGAV